MDSNINMANSKVMPIKQQRFTVLLRELDHKTYRAFKMINSPIIDNTKISNSPMFPFCVKTGRFKWQTQQEINGHDINGKMKQYAAQTIDHSTSWDEFMNKSTECPRKVIGNSKSFNIRMATLINTRRTMNTSLDLLSSKTDFNKQTRLIRLNKSKSSGTFQALMNKTPLPKKQKVKYDMTKEAGIFTPEFINNLPISNHKTFVNLAMIKQKGGYAGSQKAKRDDDFLYLNRNMHHTFSRIKKITSYKSDIFNANKSFNPNRKQCTYEYSEYFKQ